MSASQTIDDLQSDIWHLYHLLDVLTCHMVGMPHVRDGKRDADMDQASALAWIARDVAHRLAGDTDNVVDAARSA
jgi:hypothetical protein